MANLIVYEIHTCNAGAWKIDSIFDDREFAVQEAERMARTQRYSEVRAVEESFDEATQRNTTRTIFRAARDEPAKRVDRSEEALAGLRKARRPKPPPKKSVAGQIISRTFVFAVIVAAGLGMIYFVNSLF
ncbi:MAG: hypothetical protein OEO83_07880 [Alphaproteobacteria bacterium]|nr:hypothetical protein [Alphaproteobacteria bacterium]